MPYKRYRATKRAYKKLKYLTARRRLTIPSSVGMANRGPLPKTMTTSLRYSEDFILNNLATQYSNATYRLNSVQDPNETGSGHQARGFDQLMQMYDHFTVRACSFTVFMSSLDTTTTTYCSIRLSDSNVTASNKFDWWESQYGQHKEIGTLTGGNRCVFKRRINPNKFLGRPNPMSDPQLRGTATTNPVEQAYLHIGHYPADELPGTVNVLVILDYLLTFTEPKQPAQS